MLVQRGRGAEGQRDRDRGRAVQPEGRKSGQEPQGP